MQKQKQVLFMKMLVSNTAKKICNISLTRPKQQTLQKSVQKSFTEYFLAFCEFLPV